jgi:hypothetical protein
VSDRDRGQILLVGALALAVSLVVLALVLNSGIYAHNLASRVDNSAENAIEFEDEIRAGVGGLVEHTIRAEADDGTAQKDALDSGIDELESRTARYRAPRSALVNASYEGAYVGTLIRQDTDRNFTSRDWTAGDGDHDWTVVDGADGLRAFELDVVRDSLNASDSANVQSDPTFEIRIDDDSEDWTVYVYENSGTTEVVTEHDPTGTTYGPCTDDGGERTVVDVTGGTVGGEYCRALRFFGTLPDSLDTSTDLDVEYHRPGGSGPDSSVNGTYRLVVDTSITSADSRYAAYGSGKDPYVAEAVYSVFVSLYYRTPELDYVTTITVTPGEPS